jgi:transposase
VGKRVKIADFGYTHGIYRITLTDEQRRDLHRRTRAPGLAVATRGRLEMIRLANAGWSVPKIARHLGLHEQTVRTWINVLLTAGFDGLPNKPHARPYSALTPALLTAARTLMRASGRTWTGGQLAAWRVQAHGVQLSASHVRYTCAAPGCPTNAPVAPCAINKTPRTSPPTKRRPRQRKKSRRRADRRMSSGRSRLQPDTGDQLYLERTRATGTSAL